MTTTEVRPQVEPTYVEYMPEREPEKKSRLFLFLLLGALALVILGAFTLLQRRTQYRALANETEKMAVPTVSVVHPTPEPGQEDLVLPSTTQAYVESPIYATDQRLPEEVVPRYRQPRAERRVAGGHRHARSRSAAFPGARRSEHVESERRPFQDYGRPLSGTDQDGRRIEAGSGQRCRRLRGEKSHHGIGRGECSASRRSRIVQAYLRPIQRGHHPTQH